MNSRMGICLLAVVIACTAVAQQDPTKPVLRKGISVEMPVSNQATIMRAADEENATVVVITADGNLYLGNRPLQLDGLRQLNARTVYVKADARVPYQTVLTVLDALRGNSVILLTSSPSSTEKTSIMPPYGVRITLGGE